MIMSSHHSRQALIAHLKAQGILSVSHYLPLHCSAMGERFGGRRGDCPVTEDISERLMRLPFYYGLTAEEQSDVVEAVVGFDAGVLL